MSLVFRLVMLALVVMAQRLVAQRSVTIPLPRNTVGEFSDVSGLVELPGGRVVLVDRREAGVFVVDFARDAQALIGRIGDGPGEYRLPWSVYPMPGDSVAIFDRGNRRMLLITPSGEPSRFATYSSPTGRTTVVPTLPDGPQAIDSAGRLYWSGTRFAVGPGSVPNTFADSAPILRFDPRNTDIDTVAWLRRPNATATGDRGSRNATVVSAYAYHAEDGWTVLHDGTIVVVRSPEYELEVLRSGAVPLRADIATSPIPLTEFHRSEWRAAKQRAVRLTYPVENGQLGRPRILPVPKSISEPRGWPEELPPFEPGGILAGPHQTIWIARPRRSARDGMTYDVVDARGLVTLRVSLPLGSRIVGFGRGVAYATHADADGLLHLWRFPLSSPLTP